jgi:isocitrate lyase
MGSRPAGQGGRRNREGVINVSAISEQAALLRQEWKTDPRWAETRRDYRAEDVIRLRGPAAEEYAPGRRGASRLWDLLHREDAVRALGAVTGNRAVQQVEAGLRAIYLPGGPAAGANLVRRVTNAMLREQRIAPVVADAEAGLGDLLDPFDLMKSMIGAGAAGVVFGDQLPSGNQRGQLGEKVLIPTAQHVETLTAARLAADVLDVPALVIARTEAHSASLLASDVDEQDHEFLTGERTAEGYYRVQPSLYACITRGLAFAPYADLLWMETPTPDLAEARAFANIIHSQYPDQLLAYNWTPWFDLRARLDDGLTAKFQRDLAALGYRFQCITPATSPALNESVPELAHAGVLELEPLG